MIDPVYVLVSHWDCVQVRGVFTSLSVAQAEAESDAEQVLKWFGINTAEASHLIEPLNWWTSDPVTIEGCSEPITYTITRCHVRDEIRQ